MKKAILFLLFFGLLSCQKKGDAPKEEKCAPVKEKKLEMYQMSEMAALMEQMYVDNQRLKDLILKGDTIGAFPNHFLNIHKAVMTDKTDNDAFFKENAALYIMAQKLIYSDLTNAKKHFDEGVDACLNCHLKKCGGPIPRIKKLYIE